MSEKFDMSYLGIMVDMAGCPNSCRHCWLGTHKNGNITVDEFKEITQEFKTWRDENGQGIKELAFFTWWREPDYRDDYREMWELEQELSSPSRAQRFELLSTWRLARDDSYAKWAAALDPKACQISFFGMENNTDWFMCRKGAFNDQLLATERCIEAGIAPRWQLFLTKRCLGELDDYVKLISSLNLHKRCEDLGEKFEFFIGGISPEGSGYELENIRIEKDDLNKIPRELTDLSRDGLNMLGKLTEAELLEEMKNKDNPPDMEASFPCLAVNADFDVYPNNAEPTDWWKLGNLRKDGIHKIMESYINKIPPAMKANRSIPISELAKRYGDTKSSKLYDESDLVCRFMHRWGAEYTKG